MKRVYKFEVNERKPFTAELTEVRRFLKVGLQQGTPVMWYEIYPDTKIEKCTFMIFATGCDIPDGYEYKGTYLSEGQSFVWHLYERNRHLSQADTSP